MTVRVRVPLSYRAKTVRMNLFEVRTELMRRGFYMYACHLAKGHLEDPSEVRALDGDFGARGARLEERQSAWDAVAAAQPGLGLHFALFDGGKDVFASSRLVLHTDTPSTHGGHAMVHTKFVGESGRFCRCTALIEGMVEVEPLLPDAHGVYPPDDRYKRCLEVLFQKAAGQLRSKRQFVTNVLQEPVVLPGELLEIQSGWSQAVRWTQSGPKLVVDVGTAVFHRACSLFERIASRAACSQAWQQGLRLLLFLAEPDLLGPRMYDFERGHYRLTDEDRRKIKKALKGLKLHMRY
eukprot:1196352-Prorocentrum_minimum.AAC.8